MNPVTDPREQQLEQMKLGDPSLLQVEEASPISSRPPAMSTTHSAAVAASSSVVGLFEDELLGGELGGGGAGGSGGGNRWPRQETIALLKIRSEMDTAFKDANPKGPLWEEVSRKLGEFGYKRNAKKCKEKFENVHKYYKRTKEGRAGRQDGKSYKFFTELEALTAATSSSSASPASMQIPLPLPLPSPAAASPGPSGIGFSNPAPVSSSIRFQPPVMFSVTHHPSPSTQQLAAPPPSASRSDFNPVAAGATPNIGISFSSDTASFASDSSDDDMGIDEHDFPGGGEVGTRVGSQDRKRKRSSSSPRTDSCNETMMEFFERLMKQVLQKQEAMQQRFLEAIENREQDRMLREEAWKRQEVARYNREHELMAQERAIAASRDSAIITFLQKISGQTVQLPPAISVPLVVPTAPPTPPTPQPPVVSMPPPSSTPTQPSQLHHQQQHQHQQLAFLEPASKSAKYQQQQQIRHKHHQTPPLSVDHHHHHQVITAIPEQQIPPQPQPSQETGASIGGSEPSSSRWPKEEILALIQLRSGLEYRYLEAGPKGPLWEDISAGMQRIGYKRNAKRCKEKWENINKYYKKVKESNKKRPEDAKTCPYYHQLDELYRNRILGGGGSGGFPNINLGQSKPDEQVGAISDPVLAITAPQEKSGGNSEIKTSYGGLTATLFGEGSAASGDKKPEDSVKIQQYQNQQEQQLIMGDYGKIDDDESDDLDQEEDEEDDDEDEDEDEMKMGYKIEFQGQKNTANSSNGGGNEGPSFLTMVQ